MDGRPANRAPVSLAGLAEPSFLSLSMAGAGDSGSEAEVETNRVVPVQGAADASASAAAAASPSLIIVDVDVEPTLDGVPPPQPASGRGEPPQQPPEPKPSTSNGATASSNSSAASIGAAEPAGAAVPVAVDATAMQPAPGTADPPAWIRAELLPSLGQRGDLPLHFITSKRVNASDMSTNQCRFSVGKGDVDERLRPLLSAEDRRAANLTEQAGKRKPPPNPNANADAEHEHGEKKPRKKGEDHGGLRVRVVGRAGRADAEMTRWESSGKTVIKRANSVLRASELEAGDEVQVWSFRGEPGGELWLVIAKTAGEQPPNNAVLEQQPDGA